MVWQIPTTRLLDQRCCLWPPGLLKAKANRLKSEPHVRYSIQTEQIHVLLLQHREPKREFDTLQMIVRPTKQYSKANTTHRLGALY